MKAVEIEVVKYREYKMVEAKQCLSKMLLTTKKESFSLTFSDCTDNQFTLNLRMATQEDSIPFRTKAIMFSVLMTVGGLCASYSNYQMLY